MERIAMLTLEEFRIIRRILVLIVLFIPTHVGAQTVVTPLGEVTGYVNVPNDGTTGTLANGTVCFTSANPTAAVKCATSTTGGIAGICEGNCGTTSPNPIIAGIPGRIVALVFDGATTAGDYVTASTTTAGQGHDSGSSTVVPTPNLGIVLSTNATGGTYNIVWRGTADAGGGGGGVTAVTASAPLASSGGTTPNISMNNSGVTAGSYTNTNLTVDALGRITAASNGTSGGGTRTWVYEYSGPCQGGSPGFSLSWDQATPGPVLKTCQPGEVDGTIAITAAATNQLFYAIIKMVPAGQTGSYNLIFKTRTADTTAAHHVDIPLSYSCVADGTYPLVSSLTFTSLSTLTFNPQGTTANALSTYTPTAVSPTCAAGNELIFKFAAPTFNNYSSDLQIQLVHFDSQASQ